MKHTLLSLLAAVALLLTPGVGPTPAQADPINVGSEHCVVGIPSSDTLNMRAQPNTTSRVLSPIPQGWCGIRVTGQCRNGWCPVQRGSLSGYMGQPFLAAVTGARYCVSGIPRRDTLNVRARPNSEAPVLAELSATQCSIRLLPFARNGWQKIRVGATEGWVAQRFLSRS